MTTDELARLMFREGPRATENVDSDPEPSLFECVVHYYQSRGCDGAVGLAAKYFDAMLDRETKP